MVPWNNLPIKSTGFQGHRSVAILERDPVPCDQPQEVKCGDSVLDAQYNTGRLINKEMAPANLVLLSIRIEG
jgi:hypothetical protein